MTCPTCHGEGHIIKDHCPKCRGKGTVMEEKTLSVKVPPGVDSDMRLRVTEEGEKGNYGGPSGDLYVVLNVKESETFIRDGMDLLVKQPLSFAQAALGCELEIPTLKGTKNIRIEPGSQHHQRITIAGEGVPHLRGIGRGDLFVELEITIPKKLSKEQKELLEKYVAISGEKTGGKNQNSGFFQRIFD